MGHWHIELDEASKTFSAFTVGPLDFYECKRMSCGLTNVLATFQWLMESCLSDLHLNWSIIYLDDILIFLKISKEDLQRLRGV